VTLPLFCRGMQTVENDEPPESAGSCVRFVKRKTNAADMMAKVSYAVLALGDSNLLLDRQTTTAKAIAPHAQTHPIECQSIFTTPTYCTLLCSALIKMYSTLLFFSHTFLVSSPWLRSVFRALQQVEKESTFTLLAKISPYPRLFFPHASLCRTATRSGKALTHGWQSLEANACAIWAWPTRGPG